MTVAIDTNILLDILLPDETYQERSLILLLKYARAESLIISEIVYAELAVQFSERKLLDRFLQDTGIDVINSSRKVLQEAAIAWKKYTRNRSEGLQCSHCGQKKIVRCDKCEKIVSSRQYIISDFIIGGHAFIHSRKLLTRDRGFYRSYFKDLKIEEP